MIKALFMGVWISAVALGACYGALMFQAGQKPEEGPKEKFLGKVEQVKTKQISVPLISDGAVQGYVVAQFAFNIESELLKKMSIAPDSVLIDEAFRILYRGDVLQYKTMSKGDLEQTAKVIAENVNKRFGREIVHDVLVQELSFIPKEQARGGKKS